MSVLQEYTWQWKSFNRNIRAFILADLCNQLSISVFMLYFPRYLLALGHQEDLYGSLMGIGSLVTGLFAVFAGILSDRIGRRNSLIAGVSVSKLTYLMRAFLISIPLLYGAYVLNGAFYTLYIASAMPFIFETAEPESRVHAFSLRGMSMRVAGILGNMLGGFLPYLILVLSPEAEDILVYRIIFTFSLLIGLFGIFQLFRIDNSRIPTKRMDTGKKESIFTVIRKLPKKDIVFVAKFVACRMFISFGAGMFMPFMNPFFIRRFDASSSTVGLIFSCAQFAVIVGLALAPKLADRLGVVNAIIITRILALPMFLLMAFVPSIEVVAGAYLLRNTLQQMSGPLQDNFLMSGLDKRTRATASGILTAAGQGARGLGLIIAGIVITRWGYNHIFMIALITYALSAALFFGFFVFKRANEVK